MVFRLTPFTTVRRTSNPGWEVGQGNTVYHWKINCQSQNCDHDRSLAEPGETSYNFLYPFQGVVSLVKDDPGTLGSP